jgi:replication initiation protein RepC
MAQENCAPGAPQERFAHGSTGFRRLTPGLLRADRNAEGFAGLPPGVRVPGQVLAALKEAAPQLGISPRLVHAVDWLFRFTQPQDWEKGSRPIVWPSARLQREALGLSETQVKRLNRALCEAGLVAMRDSPNGKRYGKRDPEKRIVEAYGFNLAPLAARYAEFRRLAEAAKAERQAIARLRRRATIARKAIVQIIETAAEYGFEGHEWRTLAQETQAIGRALRGVERADEIAVGVSSLERRQQAARERLESLLEAVQTDGSQAENGPHQHNYKPTPYPKQDTVIAAKECSRGEEKPDPEGSQSRNRSDRGMVHGIAPDELVRLAPRLKPYLRRPSPNWPEVVDAADWLRHDLGVSKSLWGDACVTMGRDLAAVALAIVSTKEPEHFRTTPGGYFHGMVAKAKAGELHLERTVWALRRAVEPQHGRRDRRGGVARERQEWAL